MKRIATVTVLFCFAISFAGQTPRNKGIPKQHSASNTDDTSTTREHQKESENPPNQTITIYDQPRAEDSNAVTKQSQDAIDVERKVAEFTQKLVWVGLLQVLALLVQAVFFFIHSRHLGALARAASDNAVAASLNAKAIINSERPWIRVTVLPDDEPDSFVFRATVRGRTPARIIAGDATHTFVSRPDELPVPPVYNSPIFAPPQVLLVDEEWFDIYSVNPRSIIEQNRMTGNTGEVRFLCFYGRVVYEDVFPVTEKEHVPHETRWCFVCSILEGQTGWRYGYSRDPDIPFSPSGPWKYREHT